MSYKRLTERKEERNLRKNEFWVSAKNPDIVEIDRVYERLAKLEDKIESGQLVELPCKVGDTIYVVDKFLKYQLCEGLIETITINKYTKPQIWISYRYYLQGIGDCKRTRRFDLLEDVFFDKEQAEARLKELQEGKI